MKYYLALILLIVTETNLSCKISRTPAFDALIQQIVQNKPTIKPLLHNHAHSIPDYATIQSKLNRVSVVYFLIRLLTYEKLARSLHFYMPQKSLRGWWLTYARQWWMYKVSVVAIETLVLKTIIKLAIYIAMHDALDFISDASKHALTIALSPLYFFWN